jgi:hypothetical protein
MPIAHHHAVTRTAREGDQITKFCYCGTQLCGKPTVNDGWASPASCTLVFGHFGLCRNTFRDAMEEVDASDSD